MVIIFLQLLHPLPRNRTLQGCEGCAAIFVMQKKGKQGESHNTGVQIMTELSALSCTSKHITHQQTSKQYYPK